MDNSSNSTSRKFIDLIFQASSKWANWNPPYEIKVGDYGQLDKRTGEFNRKGNIYHDTDIYEDEDTAKLVTAHPPKSAAREEVYMAASAGVKRSDFILSADIEIPGLADASIKGQWAFGSKRGALLIMAHPCISYMPPDTLLERLAKVAALKGMFLVTEVFSCPAYSLYLSSGDSEAINLALVGSPPVSNTPGITAEGEYEGKWLVRNAAGLFRSAHDNHGKDNFTPLYMLKQIRTTKRWYSWRRGEVPPDPEGDVGATFQTPWDPLNDAGIEEIFEDTIFD